MTGTRVAERIEVTGIVQGVGFRPFVHRVATELGLDGCVGNDSTGAFIDVAGAPERIDQLVGRIESGAPPLAAVESVRRLPAVAPIPAGFRIVASRAAAGERALVAPDTAVCDDCLAELADPGNRRYRHPFITCTSCGPRFTIVRDLPYDRPNTTMDGFELCPACAAEYADPADRRYHAQPIACHDCGPSLALRVGEDAPAQVGGAAIEGALAALAAGSTVAIKGIGGFHLACDATDDRAVAALRRRKHRRDKPFAVMVRDLDHARDVALVDGAEADQLRSRARPVVLLRARSPTPLSALVAPGNPLVGVMLPYAPVHHLLLAGTAGPLVMTSGNLAGEPITFRDDQVAARLGPLCDAVLTHDRPIHVPCDDSVVRLVGHRSRRGDDAGGGLLPIRRSRGFAPVPVPLPGARRPVLAVGGELKNTFCVTSTDHAWVSQHLGDMGSVETLAAFEASVRHLEALNGVTPELVAVDAHPGYLTSRWARDRYGSRCLAVQHHHAHVASVMAEHGLDPDHQVIGLAFDGTGYGDDGTIWGGEVLIASAAGYRRFAHLAPVPLPGGDAAIANPYRVALAHLDAAGIAWGADLAPVAQLGRGEAGLLRRQLDRGFACVATTSMGRLFDAVASLLGLRHRISYEAQAAIDLEIAAARSSRLTAKGPAGSGPGGAGRSYRFSIGGATPAASIAIDPSEVLGAMIADLRAGRPADDIALGFHLAVADAAVEIATRARAVHGIGTVALSGGVFQNALLSTLCLAGLRDAGFEPLAHRVVPPNDGGLALGQAYIAAHRRHPPPEEI